MILAPTAYAVDHKPCGKRLLDYTPAGLQGAGLPGTIAHQDDFCRRIARLYITREFRACNFGQAQRKDNSVDLAMILFKSLYRAAAIASIQYPVAERV